MPELDEAAQRYLGLEHLQPPQRRAVELLLAGRDVLVVLQTGAGKSAVFELAGALSGGTTVVLSPLRALQRDQVRTLEEAGLGPARTLNSDASERQQAAVLEEHRRGELRFLYLAPEQLQKPEAAQVLAARPPALVAVDEAHCVSTWGQDFRPDYLLIGSALEDWGRPPAVALTATAAPPVRRDIVESLGLRRPVIIVGGVERTNLVVSVERHLAGDEKDDALIRDVEEHSGPGLVYVATQRRSEELSATMREAGIDALAYHGGLGARRRRGVEEDFLAGRRRVVVATTAFGMGIDKPDIRFVFHADVPESLDAYYQEIGRAGRDGEPATARLFYRPEDLGLRRFFARRSPPGPETVRTVLEALGAMGPTVERGQLAEATGRSRRALAGILAALEEIGALRTRPGGLVEVLAHPAPDAVAEQLVERAEHRQALSRSRVEMLRRYAESPRCRWEELRGYLGDPEAGRCGHCDNCRSGRSEDRAPPALLAVGSRVEHAEFGPGEVTGGQEDEIVVLFERAGYRTLSAEHVRRRGLLRALPS